VCPYPPLPTHTVPASPHHHRRCRQTFQKTFNLTRSYRCADEVFCALLNSIREGSVDTPVRKMLVSRQIKKIGLPPCGPEDEPIVKLVGLKSDADSHNKTMLGQLATQEMIFNSDDTGVNDTVGDDVCCCCYCCCSVACHCSLLVCHCVTVLVCECVVLTR
jgi:hypothetical protein